MTPIYTSEEKKFSFLFFSIIYIYINCKIIKRDNIPYDIPKRPQPERNNPPPPQNQTGNQGGNFNFNVFGFPFLFTGFGFSFGNNQPRNHNPRAGNMALSNFYVIFIIIAFNLLLNFGPLMMMGFGDYEYEFEKKSTLHKPKAKASHKMKVENQENDFVWFLFTMLFFFGIALSWKILKKRNFEH